MTIRLYHLILQIMENYMEYVMMVLYINLIYKQIKQENNQPVKHLNKKKYIKLNL